MSSVARRSLLTATASAAVLCALSFVPSAPDAAASPAHTGAAATTTASTATTATAVGAATSASAATTATTATTASNATADEGRLADTGSVDTTPYLVGGLASLGIGAACVTLALRRARGESYGGAAGFQPVRRPGA
jgi:hypothetical protein